MGTGELASAGVFLFIGVRASLNAEPTNWAVAFATLPLVTILAAAGCYWLLARTWVGISIMPGSIARQFQRFRVAHIFLLLCGSLVLLLLLPRSSPTHVFFCSAALMFAFIEHINYFHVRLAYPIQQWAGEVTRFRTARLRKDLTRASSQLHEAE